MNGPGRAAEQTRTEGTVSHLPQGDTPPALMTQLFAAQRHASRQEPPPPAEARRQALSTLETMVRGHLPEIAQAISQDFGGRALAETELLEAVPLLGAVRHARRHLARWIRPERRLVAWQFLPSRAYVRHEPLGVVGILSPWNYPLLLTLSPLVDALAAGNRALLKPSELTPCFSALLARLVSEAFPADRVAVVTGGPAVAAAFCALPFDHIVFTGSGAVARKVLAAAAPNLTPVTLELGGKSPAIVCPDYSLAAAARSIALGKFLNAGQTCVAPDYVLAPHDKTEELAEAILAEVRRAWPAIESNADYTAVIQPRHFQRLAAAVEEARVGGARTFVHGIEGERGRFPPTIVLDAPPASVLLREEIFGPVLPIVPYRDLDDALAFIAARERPLALYCFTHDRAMREKLLDGATSGGATVNGTLLHVAQEGLPFGGIGPSGMGAYHGHDGFLRLSHARAVHVAGPVNVLEWLGPPYGRFARFVADLMIGRRKG